MNSILKKKRFYIAAGLVIAFCALSYPVVFVDYSSRQLTSAILVEQKDVQGAIEGSLAANPPKPLNIPRYESDTYRREVDQNGEISIHVKSLDLKMLLTPRKTDSGLAWICRSDKPKDVPINCRDGRL